MSVPHTSFLTAEPVKTWEGAKLHTKVNGRWIYFYRPGCSEPFTAKEPVSYELQAVPRSTVQRMRERPKTSSDVLRQNFLKTHEKPKAPLVYHRSNPVWMTSLPEVERENLYRAHLLRTRQDARRRRNKNQDKPKISREPEQDPDLIIT